MSSLNDENPKASRLPSSMVSVKPKVSTPQSKSQINKNRSFQINKCIVPNLKSRHYFPTMEINIDPEEMRNYLSESKHLKQKQVGNTKDPRTNASNNSASHDKGSFSPRHLPVFKTATSTPRPSMKEKLKVCIVDQKDLSEEILSLVSEAVKECIYCWFEMGSEWQRLRVSAVKYLGRFISEKNEAMRSECKALGMEAVADAVSIGEKLKDLSFLTRDFAKSIEKVKDFGIHEDLTASIVCFSKLSLQTIVSHLEKAHHKYRLEYSQKKKACSDLMATCSVDVQGDECTDTLNQILSVWSNDIHIQKKDKTLYMLLREADIY